MFKVLRADLYRLSHSFFTWFIFAVFAGSVIFFQCVLFTPSKAEELRAVQKADSEISEAGNDPFYWILNESQYGRYNKNNIKVFTKYTDDMDTLSHDTIFAALAASLFAVLAFGTDKSLYSNQIASGISRRGIYFAKLLGSLLITVLLTVVANLEIVIFRLIVSDPLFINWHEMLRTYLILLLTITAFQSIIMAILLNTGKKLPAIVTGTLFVIAGFGISYFCVEYDSEFFSACDEYVYYVDLFTGHDSPAKRALDKSAENNGTAYMYAEGNKEYIMIDGKLFEGDRKEANYKWKRGVAGFFYKPFVMYGIATPSAYCLTGIQYSSYDIYKVYYSLYPGWVIHSCLLMLVSSTIGIELYRKKDL